MPSLFFDEAMNDDWQAACKNTLIDTLGIEITEVSSERVHGKMPVDGRTIVPAGVLHGGASVALAETLGSIGALQNIDYPRQVALGLDINANHIKAVRSGWVYGIATPLHLGRQTQVWQIQISNDADALVCVARLTMAIQTNS